jgi:hypothetical protein
VSYLAAVERSPLTVRTYAHDVAVYFRFLADRGVGWHDASLDLLSGHVCWLPRPAPNVVVLDVEQSRRTLRTVNRMLDTIWSSTAQYTQLPCPHLLPGRSPQCRADLTSDVRVRHLPRRLARPALDQSRLQMSTRTTLPN